MRAAKLLLNLTLAAALGLGLASCAAKVVIRSEPSDADVYAKLPDMKESANLGKTPLMLTVSELEQRLGTSANSTQLLEITVKKENFRTATYMIPSSRLGTVESVLFSKLEAGDDANTAAQLALQHLVNAQQFAYSHEYERALIEVEKGLEIVPRFARAFSMRGTIYFLKGQYDEALKWYEEAIKIEPALQEAVKMIAYLKQHPKVATAGPRVPAGGPGKAGGGQ